MTKRKTKAEKILNSLGKDPTKIARKLQRMGIKGTRRSCSSCPIAKLLSRVTKRKIEVDGDYYILNGKEHQLPYPVKEFVGLFDTKYFPFLIDP